MQVDDNFDAFLHRNVDEGTEFNDLIPEPNGDKVLIGSGDTGFSIIKMAEMVKTYSYQMKKVAAKLQTNSVEKSVENVKDFIFNHFQYKADKEDQLLRSPAYAWWIDGYDGIDCKSYSIIASCLLTEMGITHYIRRIKQPSFEPSGWTHVYVVVPIDQKKNDLSKGYYTVDGTLEEDYEPVFTQKDDLLMELKHYSLNAPAKGLGVSIGSFSLDNVKSIKSFVASLSCLGSVTYDRKFMVEILGSMEIYFNALLARMNAAVTAGDDKAFSLAVNEFYAVSELGILASKAKHAEPRWNQCSKNSIAVIITAWEYYGITVKKAMDAWLADNFVKDPLVRGPLQTYNTSLLWTKWNLGATADPMALSRILDYYDAKPKTILKFEITQYVADASASTKFDALQFLQGLSTVAGSFGSGNSSTNPNPGTDINGNGNVPSTQKAGFGAFGWVLLAVGVGVMVKGFAGLENKPAAGKKPVAKSKKAA